MNKITITLMAVASLTIAAQAQQTAATEHTTSSMPVKLTQQIEQERALQEIIADETQTPVSVLAHNGNVVVKPEVGSTVGPLGVTTTYGAPETIYAMKDLSTEATASRGAAFKKSKTYVETPGLPIGGHGGYNHDGLAFQNLNTKLAAAAVAHAKEIKDAFTFSEFEDPMADSKASGSVKPVTLAHSDYAKNIKCGKWQKFVNGQ